MPFPAEIYLDNPPIPPSDFAARCAERFRTWRRKRRWLRELDKAAALGRLDDILADVGMTRAELDELMMEPAEAGQQFEKMATMLGIECERLPAGVAHRAMQICAHCAARKRCKRWLRDAVWQNDGDPRCPNEALLRR